MAFVSNNSFISICLLFLVYKNVFNIVDATNVRFVETYDREVLNVSDTLVRRLYDNDGKSKWILFEGNLIVHIGVDNLRNEVNFISSKNVLCNGNTGAFYGYSIERIPKLVLHVENSSGHFLALYSAKTLDEDWREEIQYKPNQLAAWDNFVLLGSGVTVYLLHRTNQLNTIDLKQFSSPVRDVQIITNGAEQIVAVATSKTVDLFNIILHPETRPFQKRISIPSTGVNVLGSFTVGMRRFVTVDGPNGGIWNLDGEEIQTFSNGGASKTYFPVPLATYRHDVLLLVQTDNKIELMVSAGTSQFQQLGNFSSLCTDCTPWEGDVDLPQASAVEGSILLPTKNGIYYIEFHYSLKTIHSENWKQTIKERMDSQEVRVEAILSNRSDDFESDFGEELSGLWTVGVLEADKAAFAPISNEGGEFNVDEWVFAGSQDWSEDDMHTNLESLSFAVNRLLRDLNERREELHALLFEEEELPESLNTGLTVKGKVFADSISLGYLNEELFNEWLENLFRYGDPSPVYGTKTFSSISANDIVVRALNDISDTDFIYEDNLEMINGELIFESDVVTDDIFIQNGGSVNGLQLKEDLLLVDTLFNGNHNFESLEVLGQTKLVEVALPNNDKPLLVPVHLSPKDVDFSILQVDDLRVKKEFFAKKINGILVEDLLNLVNNKSVSTLSVEYLNGKSFPSSFIRASNQSSSIITGNKTFEHLTVKNLETQGYFENGESKGDNANITYVFQKDLRAKSVNAENVNGLAITDLDEWASKLSRAKSSEPCNQYRSISDNEVDDDYGQADDQSFTADVVEIQGSLTTPGMISGIATRPLKDYLSKTKEQTISSHVLSTSELTVDELLIEETESPNDLLDYIDEVVELKVDGKLNADEFLFLGSNISVDDVILRGFVGGVKIQELYNDTVQKSEPIIYLSGEKTHLNGLKVHDMNIHSINGHKPTNIATKDGNYIFAGPITLSGKVEVLESFISLGRFNNVNLTDIALKVSTSEGAFIVQDNLQLNKTTKVNKLLVDGNVQGIKWAEFLKDSVTVANHQFKGNFTFTNKVEISGNLNVSHLNGLEFKSLFENIVMLNETSFLKNLTLMKEAQFVLMEGELLAANIQDCHVERWKQDAIIIDERSLSTDNVQLESLSVSGDILVDLINNVTLHHVIHRSRPETIPLKLRFKKITAKEGISVQHSVNSRKLPEIWENSLRSNGSQVVSGFKNFTGGVSVQGSIFTSHLNGIPLDNIFTLDTTQNVSSGLKFSDIVVFDNATVDKEISNVDIRDWQYFNPEISQSINGSWSVQGNITVNGNIEGSGLVSNISLLQSAVSLDNKLKKAEKFNALVLEEYRGQCERVTSSLQETQSQQRIFNLFEDVQSIVYKNNVNSVISYEVSEKQFMLVTFLRRCYCTLYEWKPKEEKFKASRVQMGSISSWALLNRKINENSLEQFLISSGPRSCQFQSSPAGDVWRLTADGPKHFQKVNAFQDVTVATSKSSNEFYTVEGNGVVRAWKWEKNEFTSSIVKQLQTGSYKFIPMALDIGLALWNDDRIIGVDSPDSVSDYRFPAEHVAISNKGLIALSDGLGRIELMNMKENRSIVASVHIPMPTDLFWIDLNSPGELYLVFASEHHKIFVYQYKGASGLVQRTVLPYGSSKLSLINLPYGNDLATPHLILIHGREIHLLQAQMHGRPGLRLTLQCS